MPDMLKKYNEEVRGELQKKMGYNAARELLIRLGLDDKMD